MRWLFRFLVILILSPAAAESAVLTEEEFLSVLDASHPAMVALEREFAEAEAEEKSASVLSNPEFRVEREAWDEVAQQTTMALAWTPPLDGRRGPRVGAARAGLEAAEHRREAARLGVRAAARAIYADWWLATERREALSRHAALVNDITTRMRNRAASGEESGLTARRFELASLRVQAELVRADVDRGAALASIRAWVGGEDPGWEPLRPALPAPPESSAWQDRPSLLALEASLRAAESGKTAAGRFLTFPTLEFGWVWLEGDASGVDGPVAGLSWNVPLFDRNQAEKARSSGSLSAARAELESGTRKARSEWEAARNAYDAIRVPASGTWHATADLESMVEAALASYQAGESTDTDLLEILSSALEARLAALELYAAALAAHRALEEAAGRPLTPGVPR